MAVATATGCGASESSWFHLPAAWRLSNPLLVQTLRGWVKEGSDAIVKCVLGQALAVILTRLRSIRVPVVCVDRYMKILKTYYTSAERTN